MDTKCLSLAVAALAASTLVGCTKETVSSANIKTAGIAAIITVTATSETSARVDVELKVGGDESNTFVILESGDELFAEAGGDRLEMRSTDAGEFEAEFSVGAADTEFKVVLERPDDTSAPNSRGTLPAPFSIASPTASDSFSRADDDVVIDWTAGSTDEVGLVWDGDCIFGGNESAADTGSYTIDQGEIDATSSGETETCDIDVEVTRERRGTADSAFDSESSFTLRQLRTTSFRSTP